MAALLGGVAAGKSGGDDEVEQRNMGVVPASPCWPLKLLHDECVHAAAAAGACRCTAAAAVLLLPFSSSSCCSAKSLVAIPPHAGCCCYASAES